MKIWLAVWAVLGLAVPLRAECLDPRQVPADASWVVHVDCDGLAADALWDQLPGQQAATPEP